MRLNSVVNTEKVILYEYLVKDGEFKKITYEGPVETRGSDTFYHIRSGKYKYRQRVPASILDKIYGSRIFSLKDDEETFRQMLISYYAARIEKKKAQLKTDEAILNSLNGNRKSEP